MSTVITLQIRDMEGIGVGLIIKSNCQEKPSAALVFSMLYLYKNYYCMCALSVSTSNKQQTVIGSALTCLSSQR